MKKGQRMTKEQKKKISKSEKGKYVSDETRKKLSKSHLGQKGHWKGKKRVNLHSEKYKNEK